MDQHVDRAAADLIDQADDGLSSMAHADDVLGRKAAFGILAIFPQRYGVFGFYEFTELGSFEGVGGMGCQRFEDFDVLVIESPFVLVDRFANADHLSL